MTETRSHSRPPTTTYHFSIGPSRSGGRLVELDGRCVGGDTVTAAMRKRWRGGDFDERGMIARMMKDCKPILEWWEELGGQEQT